ncbi:MAG: hypothetical protein DCF30_18980 [Hyphomicrobiales bacterium]|nr:MAG: hypothetical protein DCF30_18980 [Hyphomicrobiales bacterium]
MSVPAYSSYQDSGIKWLGEVPGHWSIRPLKYLVALRSGGTPSKSREDFWDGPVPWASAKDLKSERISDTEDHLSQAAIVEGGVELNPPHSILILVRGMMLARAFPVVEVLVPMAINQDLKAINPKDGLIERRFLAWGLRGTARESLDRCSEAGHGTKALRMEDWLSLPFPVPPLDEQAAIAAFLDRETVMIDSLVKEQRRLIELLKEKRQAVISHAVTKGLNPDAPMKESGIEWLGKVPVHWEVRRLSTVCGFEPGKAHEPFIDDEADEHIYASARFVSTQGSSLRYCSENLSPARRNDILMVMSDLPNGRALARAFLVSDDRSYAVNQRVCIIRQNTCDPKFMYHQLDRNEGLLCHDDGMNQTHLPNRAFTKLEICAPPLAEQIEIAGYLDRLLEKFAALSREAERAIRFLNERRTALIFAAVTGKIDVRGPAEVLPFPVDRAQARGMIAAEIIERSAHQATFGRVKLQKIAYLADVHVGISELEGTYLREAAGPLDREMVREMEHEAGRVAGIRVNQPDGAGTAVNYRLGDQRGAHRAELAALLGADRSAKLDKLIDDIATIDTKGAEAVATLYAVWNDALIEGETPTDTEKVLAMLTEWHPEKKEKFRMDELHTWLGWMRRHGLVPRGEGPRTSTGRLFA